jgi:iron complex outermembrane recepter protein
MARRDASLSDPPRPAQKRARRLVVFAVLAVTHATYALSTEDDADARADLELIPIPRTEARTTPARERGAPQIEEIVVTARRTAELVQDVPIAVSVLDARALTEKNITTTNDLAVSVPGLSGINLTDRNRTVYSMRGQGEAFFGSSPGVVGYFADVPEFSSFIYDLSSIQVLKGPQGTLFGRNTTGGAVLFTPQVPTAETGGYVNSRIGNYARTDLEFGYGGPLIHGLAGFRIAGQWLNREGYTRNLHDGERLDDEGRQSVRLSLTLMPFDGVENHTILQYERTRENGTSHALHAFVDALTTPYRSQLGPYLREQQARGPRIVGNDAPLYYRSDSRGVINTAAWDVTEQVRLKNILSFRKWAFGTYADEDGSPFRILNIGTDQPTTPTYMRTGELQLLYGGWLDAVAGIYYEDAEKAFDVLNSQLTLPIVLLPYGFNVYSGSDNTSTAAFVHLSGDPLERLSVSVGYRHTVDDRRQVARQALVLQGLEVDTLPTTSLQKRYSADSWSLSASYRFEPDTMSYLTVRRGYKTGGFNPTASSPERVAYAPEYVTSRELGIKTRWWVGSWLLRLNADVFHDEYSDIQRNLVQPTAPPSSITTNAASATVRGGDIDMVLAPAEGLSFALQYTHVDASYRTYDDPQLGDLSDGMFPNTPEHQLSFSPVLRWALPGAWGSAVAQATVYWQSTIALDVTNTPNGNDAVDRAVIGSIVPGYARIDLRADWQQPLRSRLSAAAYVRNLTDRTYAVGGLNALGIDIVGTAALIYGQPRMYGVELRYDF